MAMSAKPKGQHGGVRPGSGRKPSAAKVLRTEYLNNLHKEAVKSMELLIKLRDDGDTPKDLRRQCALDVMQYAWGKPMPILPDNGEGGPVGILIALNE